MPPLGGECSIMKDIKKTEELITSLERRVDNLEDDLLSKSLPEDKEKTLETELVEVKKLLETNKKMLSNLHKDNMKSFSFAIILCCGFFLFYVIYILFGGLDY